MLAGVRVGLVQNDHQEYVSKSQKDTGRELFSLMDFLLTAHSPVYPVRQEPPLPPCNFQASKLDSIDESIDEL